MDRSVSANETQSGVPRDSCEHAVARQERCIAIEGALRDMRIRCRDRVAFLDQPPPEIADPNPVIARSLVDRQVVEEIDQGRSVGGLPGTADELGDDDRWEDDRAERERIFEEGDRTSPEEIDPDRRVNDEADVHEILPGRPGGPGSLGAQPPFDRRGSAARARAPRLGCP